MKQREPVRGLLLDSDHVMCYIYAETEKIQNGSQSF